MVGGAGRGRKGAVLTNTRPRKLSSAWAELEPAGTGIMISAPSFLLFLCWMALSARRPRGAPVMVMQRRPQQTGYGEGMEP